MSVYFDSGVITKWYIPEPDSAAALRLRSRFKPPAVLTHLHRVELTTAWYAKVFRREIALEIVERALRDLETDVRAGVWRPPSYDLVEVHLQAENLAKRHAAASGTRTLDVLHVAAAVCLGMRDLVTGDRRQATFAQAAGLNVVRFRAGR